MTQSSTLIRSKLLVPRPAVLLHRPQVCAAIERGLACKLTLVSAPAGYGKTSALADFAQHSSLPVCWYTADDWDRDLAVFIQYLIGAIGQRFEGFGRLTSQTLESLARDIFQDPSAVAGDLANEILDLGSDFVLVLDNFESLDSAFGVREFMHRFLDVSPANCHVMLGSRALPDVPVTRLVAKRQMIGLTHETLRFTPEEIRATLRFSAVEVSLERAEQLAAHSEGWITGILLLAGLQAETVQAALGGFERVDQGAYEYLARDVLDRQPPDIQHFLTTSAVLREMSSRACREVLQLGSPMSLLAEVERRNLFVTRFGLGETATFRYHNLFRDFLLGQLRHADPRAFQELHLRAAEWFERENDVEGAVYHYLDAQEYPRATRLMEQVAKEWFWRGRVETVLRWGDALPEPQRSLAPWVSLYQSKVLTDRFDYAGAYKALAHAEAGYRARGETVSLAHVRNQRATLALFESRFEDAVAEATAALEMLSEDERYERANALRHIGRAYVGLGRLDEGVSQLEAAIAVYREVGSSYNIVNLLQDLTMATTSRGRFDDAFVYMNEALVIARRLGAPTQLAGVLNNLGTLHYCRGEYEESLRLYREGMAVAVAGGDVRSQTNILVGMADLYRDVGAFDQAEALYGSAWQNARESRPGVAVYILTARADAYRWQGEPQRALVVLDEALALANQRELKYHIAATLPLSRGIALVESGQTEEGLRLLSQGIDYLESHQAQRELAQAHLLAARGWFLANDRQRSVAELGQALTLAEEIGTDQFVVVEGQHAEDLIVLGVAEGLRACRAIAKKIDRLRAIGQALLHGEEDSGRQSVGRLEVHAFGEGRVVRDGRAITSSEWQAAMVKEVFFYILLNGPVERDAVGVVFWPELTTKGVTDSFHTTLYRLRRALGPDVVTVDDGRYRIGNVDYWLDTREFEETIERARLLPS
ncbi:MAG: tetratricopeptide repeat protein, partial [Chloroflexi bacterium]|nr:tetratricopeptide repeat protein [Chloroflexota bacterium]